MSTILPKASVITCVCVGSFFSSHSLAWDQTAHEAMIPDESAMTDFKRAEQLMEAGEPEFALRLIADKTAPDLVDIRRVWYQNALAQRLDEKSEGAVFELLIHPPAGAENERIRPALQLAALWKADEHPTTRSLVRRLNWYERIQDSIQPSPLPPELPISLTLLTLDAMDPLLEPERRLLLLPLAQQVSPNNPLWLGYYPDNQRRLHAAETLAVNQEYLKAVEVYRQLINRMPDKATWFQRELVQVQFDRMIDLNMLIGAKSAYRAASMLRQDYLSTDGLSQFRSFERGLRETIAAYGDKRHLPKTIVGELKLEPIPMSYRMPDELRIRQGATLILEAGTVLQGGRLILEGGTLQLNGTPEKPVLLLGISFSVDDAAKGGRIEGQAVHFRDCSWSRYGQNSVPWGTQWTLDRTYSMNCRWSFDQHTKLAWTNSRFEECQITYAPVPSVVSINDRTKPTVPSTNPILLAQADELGFSECVFKDCELDDIMPIGSTDCGFVDCTIEQWSHHPHRTDAGAVVSSNYFEPAGQIAAWLNRSVGFVDGSGPYVFKEALISPEPNLGRVDWWVD